jgi:hypothetical protein
VARAWIVDDMEIELREYRIQHGEMDAWLALWRSGVVPLRQAAGFEVIGAWVDRQHDRFVWLLEYDGADGYDAANRRYYDSDGRAALRPDPAELIEEARTAMVEPAL